MGTVLSMLNRVEKMNIRDIALDSMADTEGVYKKEQQDQLLHGIKGDGEQIGLYANEEYAEMKHQLNPLAGFGNVDLKLTGGFHDEIQVSTASDGLIIESTDEKAGKLEDQYGDPMGLSGKWKGDYISELHPVFKSNVERKINGLP